MEGAHDCAILRDAQFLQLYRVPGLFHKGLDCISGSQGGQGSQSPHRGQSSLPDGRGHAAQKEETAQITRITIVLAFTKRRA
jgi:hypothetical protein